MVGANLLTSEQHDLIRAILDRLIPAEGDRPGAGQSGVGRYLEQFVSRTPQARRLFLQGLTEIDLRAWRQGGPAYLGLTSERQDEILRSVEAAWPDFFEQLVVGTYEGYYRDPRVLAAIGQDPRPPQPRGHTLAPFDPALLAKVRARGPIFRPVSDQASNP